MTHSKLTRRAVLRLMAGAAPLLTFTHAAAAADYPSRTVRIVCGFVAGQIPDVAARMIAERRIDVRPIITSTLQMEQIRDAFDVARARSSQMKVQLSFAT